MIDLLVNSSGGLLVAHDERALDVFDTVEVAPDGRITLTGGGTRREIGTMARSLLSRLKIDERCWMLRVNGWSLARLVPVTVLATAEA